MPLIKKEAAQCDRLKNDAAHAAAGCGAVPETALQAHSSRVGNQQIS